MGFLTPKKKVKKIVEVTDLIKSVELKHPSQIPFEITKVKNNKRVVIKKGTIPKYKKWIYWPKMQTYYWNNLSELNYDPEREKEKLIFDVDYSEPFNERGEIVKNQVVERALINQSMDDYSEVVALTGFEITKRHIVIMIIVALLFLPFGLSLNDFFHLVPNLNVHWLPSIPHFGGR